MEMKRYNRECDIVRGRYMEREEWRGGDRYKYGKI